ncbi:GNVR domain-containing protein [Mitsuokella jalaludinii]|uniref:GNVR domain-containing protein n=1 Tax=Mitsuokella jalaludinii TaxID=187979 RepID=UPI003077203E
MSKYPPDETATYLQLKSEAKTRKNIYTNLVQQREEDKVQEAMESLDIQVIDEANLPKAPSAPRKKLIAVIGLVLGCVISFAYTLVMYKREA